jgi:hypothetical protein
VARKYLRDVYLTDDPNEAAVLLDRVIAGCLADEVDEIVSLGNTLKRWRTQTRLRRLNSPVAIPRRSDLGELWIKSGLQCVM